MKGFYIVAFVLFLTGMGLIVAGAWCGDWTRDAATRSALTADVEAFAARRFWSPILIFAGGLLSISGALAFVGTIGTHARKVAKVPQTDSVI